MSEPVIVVGGGPAGILAAGTAAQSGARVTLLEKGPRLGRKLAISGKGRCNLTNIADIDAFIRAFAPNGKFLYGIFSRWFSDDLIAFLSELGVGTKVERGGRVFPESDRAQDVVEALTNWVEKQGVSVRLGTPAKGLRVSDGRIAGVEVFGGTMKAGAVILACGGASYPVTGSTGDGFAFAGELGHTVAPICPALAPIVSDAQWIPDLQGISLKSVSATVIARKRGTREDNAHCSEFGEMLFTHFGLSGPIILTLSREVGKLLESGEVDISIDLKPALDHEQLDARLVRELSQPKLLKNVMRSVLPSGMIQAVLDLACVDGEKTAHSVTSEDRGALVGTLKDFRVPVCRLRPIDEAIVTAGGVACKEIDPRTMMSRIVEGLYFAGEMIDIDAVTGGFNLQAAFSTGWLAGQSAAQRLAGSNSAASDVKPAE